MSKPKPKKPRAHTAWIVLRAVVPDMMPVKHVIQIVPLRSLELMEIDPTTEVLAVH